jgi:hypothetical protein
MAALASASSPKVIWRMIEKGWSRRQQIIHSILDVSTQNRIHKPKRDSSSNMYRISVDTTGNG